MHNQEVERAKQPASGEIHGLRTPRELFSKILNFWAWAVILGHLGYFRPDNQHPFWCCEFLVYYFYKRLSLYIQHPNIYFGLGFEFSLLVSVVRGEIHHLGGRGMA